MYNLALTALERAHDEMTRLFAPALNERAAKLFSYLAGPARTVKIDSAGAVRIEEDGAVHEIGYYSTGTADAAYIAMRLACIELLYTESKPPLVFDDSLCNLDPARKAAAFALLARLSERYQILYFTCHNETAALGTRRISALRWNPDRNENFPGAGKADGLRLLLSRSYSKRIQPHKSARKPFRRMLLMRNAGAIRDYRFRASSNE